MDQTIHVVSFNVPYPPNYGGVIDVYFKLKSLHNCGVNIILHCFDYGRGKQPILEKYCLKVFYYKRKTGILSSLGKTPYIVYSRSNSELLSNLVSYDAPILFEGLHTSYYLGSKELSNRIKIVRTHNVEHDYYYYLALQENNFFKKFYFNNAARKLKNYELVLRKANFLASISPNDYLYFNQNFDNAFWLPPFHPNTDIKVEFGLGNYALYHGNLSVIENEKAAQFLIDAFANVSNIKMIIAGKNPTKHLINSIAKLPHITLVSNPLSHEMERLISEAHVHLLPTFQATGIKLKLIASLFSGRHCLANNQMVQGTGLDNLCHKANSEQEFVQQTQKLMQIPFESSDLILRKEVLSKKFDNKRNAELLISYLFK